MSEYDDNPDQKISNSDEQQDLLEDSQTETPESEEGRIIDNQNRDDVQPQDFITNNIVYTYIDQVEVDNS